MGFFTSLDQEKYDRQYTDRQLINRMAYFFKKYRISLIIVIILVLVTSVTSALSPIIVARGVSLLESSLTTQVILVLFLAVLLTGSIAWLANWLRRRVMVRMVGDVTYDIRSNAFRSSLNHDLSFFDKYSSGKIVSRITSDTQDFGNTIVLITDLFSQIIQSVILAVVLVRIDWKLSLILFSILPFVFLAAIGFRRIARSVTRTGMRAMANVNATIKETISGIGVAKNFRQENAVYETFEEANKLSYRVNVRRGFVLALVFPTLNAIGGIATGIMVYAGGITVAEGIVTVGSWFLFLQSLDRFFFPILNLSSFWAQVQTGLSAAERVFALIDAEPQVVQTDNLIAPLLKGDIRFEDVTFSYAKNELVLDHFSLHIQPGETIALVGHTGAGKSSIAKLVERFYEFQEGKILVDGYDIRTFDLNSYRSQLGIVSQVPFLFSGTAAENICYACSSSSAKEDMLFFAKQIGNGEWMETLSDGLDTQVGERGSRLSMGQRQLIALMRVLVQRPAIFVLDEATASIDPFTEWQIQQALNLIMKNTTSILIAHRLSTVRAADRIIVLEKGKIIEEGNHENLLQAKGHYSQLYNTYFRHQSLAYVEQSRLFAEAESVK
jgi:ATP-binding cassette subfamily B protein